MAYYDNNNRPNNNYKQNNKQFDNKNTYNKIEKDPKEKVQEALNNIVQTAENDMIEISTENYQDKDKRNFRLTTTQIRKFLAAVSSISNKVNIYKLHNYNAEVVPQEIADEISYLKILLIYQSGREKAVKEFVKQTALDEWINYIGNSIEKYEKFAKYVEALVAYHKYYGGRD